MGVDESGGDQLTASVYVCICRWSSALAYGRDDAVFKGKPGILPQLNISLLLAGTGGAAHRRGQQAYVFNDRDRHGNSLFQLGHQVQDTLLRIYGVYTEWKDRVDYINVAYSGGKDSMVLLDLVKRIIPRDRLFVTWGDTGMEMPSPASLLHSAQWSTP